jgi:hypothetical protein
MTFLWVVLILVALAVVVSLISQAAPRRTRVIERVRDVDAYDDDVVIERRPRRRVVRER